MKQTTSNLSKSIVIAIIVGTILAACKLIFVELCQDEEYQIVMAYRRIMGDQLFSNMWEPHQTGSFLNAFWIRLFLSLTGGTEGIIIFLRCMGTLFQFLIAVFFYGTARKQLEKLPAFLIAAIWFNSSMGLFISAEYSSLMFWFGTLSILFMWNGWISRNNRERSVFFILAADLCMCLSVLAYPGMILFVLAVWVLTIRNLPAANRKQAMGMLIFPCVVMGAVYVAIHAYQVSWTTFIGTLPNIFLQDPTHTITEDSFWNDKILGGLKDFLKGSAWVLIAYTMANVILKKKSLYRRVALASVLSLLVPLFYWLVLGEGYECGQVQELAAAVGLILLLRKYKETDALLFKLFLYGGITMFAGGWLLSNMALDDKWCFGLLLHVGLLWMLLKQADQEEQKRFLYTMILIWCFFLLFAKGFMLRSGKEINNITSIRNICRSGPAKGIFTDYMNAYIMDANHREWKEQVQEGDRVLIVSKTLHSNVILSYLFEDVTICHCAVNNPYAYSRRLLDYWEQYPDKYPNVIAVDCWYGELQIDPDEWIMEYIQTDFAYSSVRDGAYLRYYRRE